MSSFLARKRGEFSDRVHSNKITARHHRNMNKKILIVEDEAMLSECLEAILTQFEYQCLIAPDAESALQIFKEKQDEIGIILADVGLPTISGIELFYQLKNISQDIKYILMSGFVDPDEKNRLTKDGVLLFLQKPYKMNEILDALADIFAQ